MARVPASEKKKTSLAFLPCQKTKFLIAKCTLFYLTLIPGYNTSGLLLSDKYGNNHVIRILTIQSLLSQ